MHDGHAPAGSAGRPVWRQEATGDRRPLPVRESAGDHARNHGKRRAQADGCFGCQRLQRRRRPQAAGGAADVPSWQAHQRGDRVRPTCGRRWLQHALQRRATARRRHLLQQEADGHGRLRVANARRHAEGAADVT